MPIVDIDVVTEEIEESEYLRVMNALVRTSLAHGADNKPAMLILSDNALFFGGSEHYGGKFTRVPLKGVVSSSEAGALIWKCVRLSHMEIDGERTVYICPFRGHPSKPIRDDESMAELLSHVGGR